MFEIYHTVIFQIWNTNKKMPLHGRNPRHMTTGNRAQKNQQPTHITGRGRPPKIAIVGGAKRPVGRPRKPVTSPPVPSEEKIEIVKCACDKK